MASIHFRLFCFPGSYLMELSYFLFACFLFPHHKVLYNHLSVPDSNDATSPTQPHWQLCAKQATKKKGR